MAKQIDQLDVAVLVRGLLQDLTQAVGAPPPTVGQIESGLAQIRELQVRLTEISKEPLERVAATYSERSADMEALLLERRRRLEAYAGRERRVVVPESGKFIVAGRVTDGGSGNGLPNVRVRATDLDGKHDEVVGETHTDALGYYRIEYAGADFADFGGKMPEMLIEVLGDDGEPIFASPKSFVVKAGHSEYIAAAVDGQKTPTSLRLGTSLQGTITARLSQLDLRARVLAGTGGAAPAAQQVAKQRRRRLAPAGSASKTVHVPVTEVSGIGPASEAKLLAHGVRDAAGLAKMKPQEVQETLGVNAEKAEAMIAEAKRLARGERS